MIQDKFINQTEDVDLQITILQDNGIVLDMTGAQAIYLVVHDGYNIVWSQFTKANAGGDWLALDVSQQSVGILNAHVLTSVTKNMRPGRYFAEVRIRYASLVWTDDNYYDIVERMHYLFTIKESVINKINPLP